MCSHTVPSCAQCDGSHAHEWNSARVGEYIYRCDVCDVQRCTQMHRLEDGTWALCSLRTEHLEPHDFGSLWVPVTGRG